jgi:hypothetical protein
MLESSQFSLVFFLTWKVWQEGRWDGMNLWLEISTKRLYIYICLFAPGGPYEKHAVKLWTLEPSQHFLEDRRKPRKHVSRSPALWCINVIYKNSVLRYGKHASSPSLRPVSLVLYRRVISFYYQNDTKVHTVDTVQSFHVLAGSKT